MCYEMWNWKETIKNIIQKRPSISLYLTVYCCTHLTNQTQERQKQQQQNIVSCDLFGLTLYY